MLFIFSQQRIDTDTVRFEIEKSAKIVNNGRINDCNFSKGYFMTGKDLIRPVSFTRNSLEKVGKKLATFTNNNTLAKDTLTAIDLDAIQAGMQHNKNAFHNQIPKLSQKLSRKFLGNKLLGKTPVVQYTALAGKIVPQRTFDKVTDNAFHKIGQLAQQWADFDLKHDPRFTNPPKDDSERHALAQSIAHQNRALATFGGVSNLAGLTGILLDTLWLLTVSLRSIFQIAQIYDKPLTGQQGITIAFEILANTDLNKLQEKQTLLAGLGVVEAVADEGFDAYRIDRSDEDNDYSSVQSIFGKVEDIAHSLNINLGKFNFNFLHKILPLSAVGIGASYNNIIIHEIVTIAIATFAPKPKLATITQK